MASKTAPTPSVGQRLIEASRSRFFEGRSPEVADRAAHLVDEVVPRLDLWASRFPMVRRERIGPLTLSAAAASPFSSADALEATARVSLWVFALDDVMDEGLLGGFETAQFLSESQAILRGDRSPQPEGSLTLALAEVCEGLREYELFREFGDIWSDAVATTISDMQRENAWREAFRLSGHAALPTFEEYVACGRYSIGGPPHIWAEVLTLGDPSACDAIDHLLAMEEAASVCIRLANDLQSEQKEACEKNVNSIVIAVNSLMADGVDAGRARELARRFVMGRIAAGLSALDALQSVSRTTTGHPEAAIADIARFVCEFYRDFDYHTFSASANGRVTNG